MALAGFTGAAQGPGKFDGLSFGWPMLIALLLAMLATAGLALLIEWLLFGRLRRRGSAITLVIASFGASLALRNLIAFTFGPQPQYFSRDLQIAIPVMAGVRVTPDQLFVVGLTAALVVPLHHFLPPTALCRPVRPTAQQTTLPMLNR